jgi:hypothetical protein
MVIMAPIGLYYYVQYHHLFPGVQFAVKVVLALGHFD